MFNVIKRPKSTNVNNRKNINTTPKSNNTNNTNKDNIVLSLDETREICDIMIQKLKYTLELVKAATILSKN